MMTIQQALREQCSRLTRLFGNKKQAWFEAELLLAHILRISRLKLVTSALKPLSPVHKRTFVALVNRRLKQEPIAYLLGQAPFFGHTFFVDKRVLIPRPETEWLVKRSLEILQGTPSSLVWDVGTGSGIISLSISQQQPKTEVIASDLSKTALVVAKKNAKRLDLQHMRFFQGSLLSPSIKKTLRSSKNPSILVIANLPYLPKKDRPHMKKQVTKYEPGNALFAPDHGSALIKQLLEQLNLFQKEDGRPFHILLELDPPQALRLKRFSQKLFPDKETIIHLDFNQKKRFLEIQ